MTKRLEPQELPEGARKVEITNRPDGNPAFISYLIGYGWQMKEEYIDLPSGYTWVLKGKTEEIPDRYARQILLSYGLDIYYGLNLHLQRLARRQGYDPSRTYWIEGTEIKTEE